MPAFKFVISHQGKSYQVEKDQKDAPVLGKKLGDKVDGSFLGLNGYELEITGGSDKDGFPMRPDIEGVMRRRILLEKGIGFRADVKGLRRRKMVRGNTIAQDIAQVNCKVTKAGHAHLDEVLGKKEKAEEGKTEVKAE
jgi:small subunit ribosomal protein S6e